MTRRTLVLSMQPLFKFWFPVAFGTPAGIEHDQVISFRMVGKMPGIVNPVVDLMVHNVRSMRVPSPSITTTKKYGAMLVPIASLPKASCIIYDLSKPAWKPLYKNKMPCNTSWPNVPSLLRHRWAAVPFVVRTCRGLNWCTTMIPKQRSFHTFERAFSF